MGEGGCGSRNPTCFLLTLLQYAFYEWDFLLILESDKKGLQSFPEKGKEEGRILGAVIPLAFY